MALSGRFTALRRHRGYSSNVAVDLGFKVHLTAQIAPRHSWGGTASTQTKIDVRDEELDSIKGNLAFRFKAAKAIYARSEDLSLEPLTSYERLDSR